jgi:hypothetical protein
MAALLAAAAATTGAAAPPRGEGMPPLPPPRAVPGVNAPDMYPHGCIDCHLNYQDLGMDVRISTHMKQWCAGAGEALLAAAADAAPAGVALTGRHPDVADALADIPGACLACHGEQATDAPPFARLMHRIHLEPRPDNPFLSMFQGECTHCHKLDLASGAWHLPSGPER